MNAATVANIVGIGPMFVTATANEVTIARSVSVSGQPLNCVTRRVSRSKRNADKAMRADAAGLHLKALPGYDNTFTVER